MKRRMEYKDNLQPRLLATQRLLMAETWTFVGIALCAVAAYELGLAEPADAAGDSVAQYGALTAMELLTICAIPVALKMFSLKAVRRQLASGGAKALRLWGTLRITLIGLPMALNTLLYYQFMAVAFAYMAIIGLVCLMFVFPSKGRCADDTQPQE